ncbi:MAG: PaaI family thioesterase [Acidimicrobiales bacterium]
MATPVLGVQELQSILQGAFPDSEVPHVEEVTHDHALVSYAVTDRHGRPGGTIAGPVMMSLADTSAWVAIMAQIGPVVLAVTTSLHIDFLRKPELTDLMAKTTILKLGKRLAVVDVALFSRGSTDLVAKAQVTYSLPPSPSS